ncbi:uncharacterized protein LOC124878692 isoform X3 [Girardinichthys multiradiatus]|uniref:uncharacterized protein LOC124878692 isoform X3 n=1 Tax=Girardinichthys multiradiatus TaxID=208333 RepID=UPI001FACACA3|nr:uncharacterized protein LOC124878692 isoform X3 [Girardinichthys multiradiatus]
MTETYPKTTQVSFRLNQDLRTHMKASNVISKQKPVSILKRTVIPNAPAAKSAGISRVLKESGTVSKKTSSCGAAGSKLLHKVYFSISTNSTTVSGSGCSGTNSRVEVFPRTMVTSLAPAKMPKQPVKPINAPKIGPVKKLTGVNIEAHADKRNSPPATKTTMLASSMNEKLVKEASTSRSLVKIGLNQLIIVSCEEKQQVYCQLCSVRLRTSSHSTSLTHCCNYVKMKYPGWTADFSNLEEKLKTIVVHLAEIEKSLGSQKPQRMEVKKDLYQKLAALSEKEAVEELKAIVKQDPRVSSSTAEIVKTSLQMGPSICEVSSSDDGKQVQQKEILRFPGNDPSEEKSERLHQIRPLHVKETVKQDPFIPDSDAQHHKVTLARPSPRMVPKADPLFPLERLCLKSTSPSPDPPKAVSCRPTGEICNPQKRAAPVPIKQNGPSLDPEEVPKHDAAPGEHCKLQSKPITSLVSEVDTKQVIGIDSVWECQGICLETFFLCESCEETLSRCNICQHMASLDHQLKYMWKKHPDFLQMFWWQADLPRVLKMNILQEVVWRLGERDRVLKIDAKCIVLKRELHQFVKAAPFSEGLKMLQNIFNEGKPTVHLLFRATHQLMNAEGNAKSTVLKDMSIVGTTNVGTEMVFGPVYMKSSSSKTNLLGCSVPNPGLNLAKGTKPDPFLKPEFTSAVSWPQSSGQKPDPESTPCTAVKNLEVSIAGPTRKRPADTSVQTLHKTSSPLKDLLPAKRTLITQKIKSESSSPTSVSPPIDPAAGPSLHAVKNEDSGPKRVKSSVDQDFSSKLISHLKCSTSKRNHFSKSVKNGAKTNNPCATSSLEVPHTSWGSKIVNIKSESVSHNWISNCQLVKATGRKTSPSNSLKASKMVTSGLECKKELFTPGVDASSSANISSSEDFLKRSIADARTEDKLITAVATSADLCDLPNLQFFNTQKMCVSRGPSRCAATNYNSGRIPEPKRDPEADGAVVRQLCFNTIRNDQPNTIKPLFQGSY